MPDLRPIFTADDLTGAADLGTALLRRGIAVRLTPAHVFFSGGCGKFPGVRAPGVGIVNLDCRDDPPDAVRRKFALCVERLGGRASRRWYHKIDSTLRGEPGYQVRAVMECLEAPIGAFVAANPAQGRITRRGVHYVEGTPLARSSLVRGPGCQPRRSRIRDILSVAGGPDLVEVHLADVRRGADNIRRVIASVGQRPALLIFDAETEGDLRLIARGLDAVPLVFGAAALVGHLVRPWRLPTVHSPRRAPLCAALRASPRMLIVSGSATAQASAQVASCLDSCNRDTRVVERSGFTSRSGFLARVRALFRYAGRLVIAGGRTAEEVCAVCGLRRIELVKPISDGVSIGVASGRKRVLIVLKPGNYGPLDAYRRIARAMDRFCRERVT